MVAGTIDGILDETRRAVNEAGNGRSWRKLSEQTGIPRGTLYVIGNAQWQHVSWPTIRKVRCHLGLPDPGELTVSLGCPDCGSVHASRCFGKPDPVVVVVSGHPKRRKPSKAIRIDPQLYERLKARKEPGETWTEFLDLVDMKARAWDEV
jgi:hypothetical protein